MFYEGDIVYRKNIFFQDTGKIDYKIGGHPTLNIIYENQPCFLVISTTYHYKKKTNDEFYPLKPTKGSGLKKKSYINLSHIYKCEDEGNKVPSGKIPPEEYEKIMKIIEEKDWYSVKRKGDYQFWKIIYKTYQPMYQL